MTDTMMTAMEAEMKTGMVMEEKEMMTDMVGMGIHMVVMVIVMVEIMRIAATEMATGMMIIGEEVEAMMTTTMVQEVEVLIGIGIELMKMMVNIHLGICSFYMHIGVVLFQRHSCSEELGS